MKRFVLSPLAFFFCLSLMLALAGPAQAAPRTYQVTGPVLEVGDGMIVVQKGKERWQLERDASTKAKGDIKVGDKVTIEYRMTATSIENKGAAEAEAKGAKKPDDKSTEKADKKAADKPATK